MALKAKKPEPKEKRLKMFVYGQAGVGKTLCALQFPDSYIIDTERGTENYASIINKSNSVVLQSFLPDEIEAELRQLLTTKHNYKTLIIDPVTQIYNSIQEKWTKRFESYAKTTKESDLQDFGMRYWPKVKGEFKRIQRMLLSLDMNLIIIAHQKDVYGNNFSKLGTTFDSMKGDDYFFDLIFQIIKKGDKRIAITIKERSEIGKNKFPDEFEWSYANFLKYFGKEIIEKTAIPVKMADTDTVRRIINMVNMLKIDEKVINKWFSAADITEWADMTKVQIDKCDVYLQDKLASISPDRSQDHTTEKKGGKKGS